jgi:uncharacterized protein YacL
VKVLILRRGSIVFGEIRIIVDAGLCSDSIWIPEFVLAEEAE